MLALIIIVCILSYHAYDLVKRVVMAMRRLPDRIKDIIPRRSACDWTYYWPSWLGVVVFGALTLTNFVTGLPHEWVKESVLYWICRILVPFEAAYHLFRFIQERRSLALVNLALEPNKEDDDPLLDHLPDELVKNWIRDHPGIKATLITYEIDRCFDEKNEPCKTPEISDVRKKMSEKMVECESDVLRAVAEVKKWLQTFKFSVKWKFNPLKRVGLEVADSTNILYALPLKDVFNAFSLKCESVEYVPADTTQQGLRKVETYTDANGEVKERWRKDPETGRYKQVISRPRSQKGKSIGDVVHSVTAQRQNRLCNGNNVYLRGLVEVNQFWDRPNTRACVASYRSVLFDPEIAGAATTGVDCKVESVLTSYVSRALEGNAISQALIGQILPGTVEVAQINSAELMGKVMASGKAVDHMSRTYVEHALRKRNYRASIKKLMSGDGDLGLEQFKLAENMHHLDETECRPLKYRKYALLFAGLALSLPLIETVAAKMPAQPAKRAAKIFRPGPKTNPPRPSGKWFLPDFDQDARNNSFAPSIGMFPFYDRKSIDVAEASFKGRIMKDNGMASLEGNRTLLRATKYALAQLQPPALTDLVLNKEAMLNWINTRPAWTEKKKQIHRDVLETMPDVIDDAYMRNHSSMEAFIKDEYYSNSEFAGMHTDTEGKLKAPRNICDRQKEFKIVAGTVLQAVNDWFFEHDFAIKHIPHPKRGQYIADRFAGRGRCITTDHSAFESSANAINQLLCEQLFYRKMVPRELWFVCDVICQPNIIKNKATGAAILTDTIRYSGDITTSVGNSILNYCSALAGHYLAGGNITLPALSDVEEQYIQELRNNYGAGSPRPLKALGDPYVTEMEHFEEMFANLTRGVQPIPHDLTLLVEGDDAILAAPSLAEPEDYQKHMRCMGLAVTIEGSSDASKAGFCSIYWQETKDGIRTYTDPIDNLINSLWSTRKPTKQLPAKELLKSKWMAVCNQFPSCPCVWNLVQDMTAQYVPDSFFLRGVLDAQGKKYSECGEYLRVECSPIPEPSDADRGMFHELFGLSPQAQKDLEAKGYEGMLEMIRFCRATGRLQDMYVNASDSVLYVCEP